MEEHSVRSPLRNQECTCLNEEMAPCPTWVSGANLYRGDRAGARILARRRENPSTIRPHTRKPANDCTGPEICGRYLPDGNIEFLGREDDQVKLQGYRIELGEIEATLERHPDVKSAVVMAVGERASPKHLVAYVVDRDDRSTI